MCLAIPGKVVEINGENVIIDYKTEKRKVKSYFDLKLGDYVVVSNKIVIKKIPKKEALEAIDLITNSN